MRRFHAEISVTQAIEGQQDGRGDFFRKKRRKIFDTRKESPIVLVMKILQTSLAATFIVALTVPVAKAQETATTDPVGFVTVNVTPGNGTAKTTTLLSLPLLETENIQGQVSGVITGVTATSLSNSSAGWTAGGLSSPASPYLIMITSGSAQGRMFLISSSTANTASTVTISAPDAVQVDLAQLGIVLGTDTYKIYACDTLSSFFGTPASSGILGGTSANTADTLILVSNGAASTFYFNTTLNRWTRAAFGNPDASNEPLLPFYGVQYARLSSAPLSFVVTGGVPTIKRQVEVKNSGPTLLAQYWPAGSTLSTLGLQSIAGWRTGASASVADTVVLTTSGSATTYFYDGTNWRRVAFGSPISNDVAIDVGTTVKIARKGATATDYDTLVQNLPYTLN
jgi:hypothetical protein